MCNERTQLLRREKEWPDALRRRGGRIVPAHKFKPSQYRKFSGHPSTLTSG
jgi:hypothetical protein